MKPYIRNAEAVIHRFTKLVLIRKLNVEIYLIVDRYNIQGDVNFFMLIIYFTITTSVSNLFYKLVQVSIYKINKKKSQN